MWMSTHSLVRVCVQLGSLICSSALSSIMPCIVPASLSRGYFPCCFHLQLPKVFEHFLLLRDILLLPLSEVTSSKKCSGSHWCILKDLIPSESVGMCDIGALTSFHTRWGLSFWAWSTSNPDCLNFASFSNLSSWSWSRSLNSTLDSKDGFRVEFS
jgi:hypothetical protein